MKWPAKNKGGGVYRLEGAGLLLGVDRRKLPDAVPALADGSVIGSGPFGWIGGVCSSPGRGDRYVVEFLGDRKFRFLAYIDRYGRVFSCSGPMEMPPAHTPDLDFAHFSGQPVAGEERGCVQVYEDGKPRQVAQYAFRRGRYSLFDSWFDFGDRADGLSYDDAMARAYLAFVHRPSHGGARVPERGTEKLLSGLRGEKLTTTLQRIVTCVAEARQDPALRPPALVACLARWLEDAGIERICSEGASDDALRLVRTARYANTFFIASSGERGAVSKPDIWAVESALNRFLLVGEMLGGDAERADERACLEADGELFDRVSLGTPSFELGSSMPKGELDGEWEVRAAVCAALERLRLPVRLESRLRVDVAAGMAAFELTVPDAGFMPTVRWGGEDGLSGPVAATQAEREAQARRYAMRLGLAAVATAFRASPRITCVNVTARLVTDESDAALYRVAFGRSVLQDIERLEHHLNPDPTWVFASVGAVFDLEHAAPFEVLCELASTDARRLAPESVDRAIPPASRAGLGAEGTAGLRIEYDAARRRIGERLADRIVTCDTTPEAIRIAREEQDAALARGDDETVTGCMRLMSALAQGSVDAKDQNAVVGRFLGEDRCLVALGHARTLSESDPAAAVEELIGAVAEASALDGFVDGPCTAWRYFDSYASRVCYNQAVALARELGRPATPLLVPDLPSVVAGDVDREVRLVPDSFYLCHLEIERMLERSFERADEALRYGRRAIELGPSTAVGYRHLGRAYMLVGDMDNAAVALKNGLDVAVQPTDIAMLYYQLGYVLWKAGETEAACACYLKSLKVSPVLALQVTSELQELVNEAKLSLPSMEDVDGLLAAHRIPVAPTDRMLAVLERGAVAATDAEVFPAARNLLALRLRYRTDDALVSVLQSLE